MVFHLANGNPRFLQDFAAHRILETLARLDETGDRGVAARRPGGLATEQCPLSIRHQHDDGRIGAGKLPMLAVFVRAEEYMARLDRDRPSAAATTESMTLAPQHHCTGIREDAGFVAIEIARHQAQIDELGTRAQGRSIRIGQLDRETQLPVKFAEQDRLCLQLLEMIEPPQELRRQMREAAVDQTLRAPHRHEQGLRVAQGRAQASVVLAQLREPFDIRPGQIVGVGARCSHQNCKSTSGNVRAL